MAQTKILKAILALILTIALISSPSLAKENVPKLHSSQFETNDKKLYKKLEGKYQDLYEEDIKNFKNPADYFQENKEDITRIDPSKLKIKKTAPVYTKSAAWRTMDELLSKDSLKKSFKIFENIVGPLNKISISRALLDMTKLNLDLALLNSDNEKNAMEKEIKTALLLSPLILDKYNEENLTENQEELNDILLKANIEYRSSIKSNKITNDKLFNKAIILTKKDIPYNSEKIIFKEINKEKTYIVPLTIDDKNNKNSQKKQKSLNTPEKLEIEIPKSNPEPNFKELSYNNH